MWEWDPGVPGQILIAFVPKLKLYGFWRGEGWFAEFLKILENQGMTGLGVGPAPGPSWYRTGPSPPVVTVTWHDAEPKGPPSPQGMSA